MADGQPLTHNELWDDSVLQDSWNEAVEEYNVRDCVCRSTINQSLSDVCDTIALPKSVC